MSDPVRLALNDVISEGIAALQVRRGERALVSGSGPTARLAVETLERLTALPVEQLTPQGAADGATSAEQADEVDVLVDTSGDPTWWSSVLARARRQGRVLLLIHPGEQIYAFNFCDRIHRSSLSLLVRRVPSPR